MHLALWQPVIPNNTGAIGRLCVGLGAEMHIVGPCAFDFSDIRLRRAGLDYWPNLKWTLHPTPEDFHTWLAARPYWLVTKRAQARWDRVSYSSEDVIILGNENNGLPTEWLHRNPERTIGIPIPGPVRSFNLANAAAIVLATAVAATGGFDGVPLPHTGDGPWC